MEEQQNQNTESLDLQGIYTENKINSGKHKKSKKRFGLLKLFILIVATGMVASIFLSSKTISGNGPAGSGKGFSWLSNFSIVSQISNIAKSSGQKLKGEERGRINILLTGIGGKNHDGGLLADTIMLMSLDVASKKVALVSIPRDLTVPIEGYGWRKINSVNAFAEKANPDSGGQVFASAFTEYFSQPIDYYLRVDFSGFAKFVDDLGGVDVMVENQLDDYAYPILGQEDNPNYYSRYEHLHVETGLQHMNGSLALKFARSRHGINGEGSDFARARRQQLIIEAVKTKLKETNFLFKPSIVTKTIENYQEHVSTNMQVWEMMKIWSLFKDVQKDEIVNKVVDDAPDNLLRSSRGADGAYILVPRAGDFSEIQNLMTDLFSNASASTINAIETEKPTITILNGTYTNGLASKIGNKLTTNGFTLVDVGNADKKTYSQSIIYNLATTTKQASVDLLILKTGAKIETTIPEWLTKQLETDSGYIANYTKPDFVLIIGQDITSKNSTSTATQ